MECRAFLSNEFDGWIGGALRLRIVQGSPLLNRVGVDQSHRCQVQHELAM